MVTVGIQTIGEQRFIRGFSRVSIDIKDMKEPFGIIYEDFKIREQRIFKAQGKPEAWESLSDIYGMWKAINHPGLPIMVLTGALKKALTKGEGTAIKDIKKQSARFGTSLPYAHRHQEGIDMPQRKIIQLTEIIKKAWSKIIHRWAMGLFDKHGITDRASYKGTYGI